LFAVGATATGGRLRLALAWLRRDLARGAGIINADVRTFLDAQVLTPFSGAELNLAKRNQLGGLAERSVLDALGHLAPVVVPPGGGDPVPAANAEVRRRRPVALNEVLLVPDMPFARNVRDKPGMHGLPFAWLERGDIVNVMGTTHDWVAIDSNGRLGFVANTQVRRS